VTQIASRARAGALDAILVAGLEAPALAASPGAPPVVRVLTRLPESRLGLGERLAVRGAAAILVPTEALRTELLARGDTRVCVVPPGIRLPEPAAQAGAGLRVLVPGPFVHATGHHAALDSLGRLRPDERRDVRMVLAGEVVDRQTLDRLRVQAYGLPVDVVPDPPARAPLLWDAHAALFPSLRPLSSDLRVREALAAGLAVAVYAQPGLEEAARGVPQLVPADDPVALRDVLRAWLRDPEARAAQGARGRAWASTQSWASAWARTEGVLRSILRGAR
jgi:glycosyltransferase involved in cell wall biosynthesis